MILKMGNGMLAIKSQKELEDFSNQRALVTLFVDHAYCRENIVTILGMREGFNAHVGPAWHMLIPTKFNDYAIDAVLSADTFGVELSRQIISEYALKHSDLPAIIFEFVPQKEHYCVKLGGMSDKDIRDVIGYIADIVTDEFNNGPKEVAEFRERIHNRILIYLRQRKALSIFTKTAPPIAAVIGVGSYITSFFK